MGPLPAENGRDGYGGGYEGYGAGEYAGYDSRRVSITADSGRDAQAHAQAQAKEAQVEQEQHEEDAGQTVKLTDFDVVSTLGEWLCESRMQLLTTCRNWHVWEGAIGEVAPSCEPTRSRATFCHESIEEKRGCQTQTSRAR